MNKNITNYNNHGQLHGYFELYKIGDNSLKSRGTAKNGITIGYIEYHAFKLTEYIII